MSERSVQAEAKRTSRWQRVTRSHPYVAFVARRMMALVLLAIGITFVAFVLTQLVPQDPAAANLGAAALRNPDAVAAFRERYGTDRSLPLQYLTYLGNLVQGDLGTSTQTDNAVRKDLARTIPATAELAALSVGVSTVVGVGLGLWAALRRNRLTDHALRVVSLVGVSVPTFWAALGAYYVFFFRLGWFPGGGRLDPGARPPTHRTGLYTIDALLAGDLATFVDAFRHLLLPALVLGLFSVGVLTRYTRSAVLEVLGSDYIQAARAKGLPTRTVVFGHIMRAALPSVMTVVVLVLANVLTGAVLVEQIFSWPGMGQYAFHSALTLDLPAIMGTSMFVAVVYVTLNFLADVIHGAIDPRIQVT